LVEAPAEFLVDSDGEFPAIAADALMLDSSAARVFAEPNRRFRREDAMVTKSYMIEMLERKAECTAASKRSLGMFTIAYLDMLHVRILA
jgi:hypothetical protein